MQQQFVQAGVVKQLHRRAAKFGFTLKWRRSSTKARTNDRPRRSPSPGPRHRCCTCRRSATASGLRDRRHRCAHLAALARPQRAHGGRWQAAGRAPHAKPCSESGRARTTAGRGQRAALRGRTAGANRAHAGRPGHLPGQRIQLQPCAARSGTDSSPRPCQGAQGRAPANHAHRRSTAVGVVLGHDLPAGAGARTMVPPLSDPDVPPLKVRSVASGDSNNAPSVQTTHTSFSSR
jgi:hypothetical protein